LIKGWFKDANGGAINHLKWFRSIV